MSGVNVTKELGSYNYSSAVFWQMGLDQGLNSARDLNASSTASLDDLIVPLAKYATTHLDARQDGGNTSHLILAANSGDALIHIYNYAPSGYFTVDVLADTVSLAEKWISVMSDLLPSIPPHPEVPYEVPLTYWLNSSMGPSSFRRWVDSQPWEEISSNYPLGVQTKMNRLASLTGFDEGGKLVLLHGTPGTGKTRAILGLVETWRQWANVNIITDPDQFFGDASYMLSVVMNADPNQWNIVVIEDGDEFMDAADSGRKSQSVGRLLNLNDGFIGQGMKIATVISTNVNLESFNSAVTRPGRCLANIEFPAFSPEEAALWLADHDIEAGDDPLTLAQMYEKVRSTNVVRQVMARFDKK